MDDMRMIVGELKGEFKHIKETLSDVADDVKGLREDFHQRKGVAKVLTVALGGAGGILTYIGTKLAAAAGLII